MNTADKSISMLDVALRRRFAFVEYAPDPGAFTDSWESTVGGVDVGAILETLNARLRTQGIERGRAIGHSLVGVPVGAADPIALLEEAFPVRRGAAGLGILLHGAQERREGAQSVGRSRRETGRRLRRAASPLRGVDVGRARRGGRGVCRGCRGRLGSAARSDAAGRRGRLRLRAAGDPQLAGGVYGCVRNTAHRVGITQVGPYRVTVPPLEIRSPQFVTWLQVGHTLRLRPPEQGRAPMAASGTFLEILARWLLVSVRDIQQIDRRYLRRRETSMIVRGRPLWTHGFGRHPSRGVTCEVGRLETDTPLNRAILAGIRRRCACWIRSPSSASGFSSRGARWRRRSSRRRTICRRPGTTSTGAPSAM